MVHRTYRAVLLAIVIGHAHHAQADFEGVASFLRPAIEATVYAVQGVTGFVSGLLATPVGQKAALVALEKSVVAGAAATTAATGTAATATGVAVATTAAATTATATAVTAGTATATTGTAATIKTAALLGAKKIAGASLATQAKITLGSAAVAGATSYGASTPQQSTTIGATNPPPKQILPRSYGTSSTNTRPATVPKQSVSVKPAVTPSTPVTDPTEPSTLAKIVDFAVKATGAIGATKQAIDIGKDVHAYINKDNPKKDTDEKENKHQKVI